jgi:hypothetical protein
MEENLYCGWQSQLIKNLWVGKTDLWSHNNENWGWLSISWTLLVGGWNLYRNFIFEKFLKFNILLLKILTIYLRLTTWFN